MDNQMKYEEEFDREFEEENDEIINLKDMIDEDKCSCGTNCGNIGTCSCDGSNDGCKCEKDDGCGKCCSIENIKIDKMKEVKKSINMDDGRYGLDDSQVSTKLLDKNFSPMIIRKYTRIGFPLYVHLICDENLDDLDFIVHDCIDYCKKNGILKNSIQSLRNFTGILSEKINDHYDAKKRGCVESLGVIFYADKMIISSLQGDSMNHLSCRLELYQCLNLMTQI